MPKNTRDWAKRHLEASCKNVDWAGHHVNQVETVYREHHPEIADPLLLALKLLEEFDNLINKVRDSI